MPSRRNSCTWGSTSTRCSLWTPFMTSIWVYGRQYFSTLSVCYSPSVLRRSAKWTAGKPVFQVLLTEMTELTSYVRFRAAPSFGFSAVRPIKYNVSSAKRLSGRDFHDLLIVSINWLATCCYLMNLLFLSVRFQFLKGCSRESTTSRSDDSFSIYVTGKRSQSFECIPNIQ